MLAHLCTTKFWRWASVPHVFFRPIWLYDSLGLSIVSERWMIIMQLSAIALLSLAMVGVLTRVALAVAGGLLLYLLALPSNFGKVGHGDAILVLTTFILALSRCDEALSLEHFVLRKNRPAAQPSGEYRWPIVLVCVLMSLVFFGAGVTKLRRSGLAWITSNHFANLIAQHHRSTPSHWSLFIAAHPALYHTLAGCTILGEILFPLALFSRRLRPTLVFLAFVSQVLIGLTLGVWFLQFMLCYIFWIPWTDLASRMRSRSGGEMLPATKAVSTTL
jgi:hypothetical protein